MICQFNAEKLARPEIVAMAAYESARSQFAANENLLFLDANELQVSTHTSYQRYPDPDPIDLRQAMCRQFGCKDDEIFIGPGADSAIDALMRVFITPYVDSIIVTPPTYGYYEVAAKIQGATIKEVPLIGRDFCLDARGIIDNSGPQTKLVFICSPNNPTGNSFSHDQLVTLAESLGNSHIVVVDEAYSEFSATPSVLALGKTLPENMVILKTLSKAYGLAGLRLGAAIAVPSVIQLLKKVRAPYPIPAPVVEIALKELAKGAATGVNEIKEARQALFADLTLNRLVRRVWPSDGNFILAEFKDADAVWQALRASGIIVRRRRDVPSLANCLRITVGRKEDHARIMMILSALAVQANRMPENKGDEVRV